MIQGQVTAGREAVVILRLVRFDGSEVETEAVIDTGFTEHLTLSPSQISSLGWSLLQINSLFLADGTEIEVGLYEGIVLWNGQERVIPTHSLEGSSLIGMSMLLNHRLSADVQIGGAVTISALAKIEP